jgi:hypothetical protein
MTECTNEAMRDLLPELAHDALSVEETARVRAHVAACAACASEMEILRTAGKLFDQFTPGVNTAAIVAALPAAPNSRPVLTLERPTRRRFAMPRYALAAAASLLILASLSLPSVLSNNGTDVAGNVSLDSGPLSVTAPVAILGASALDDLGSDELEALLAELETMEATVAAEPASERRPITTTPEGN